MVHPSSRVLPRWLEVLLTEKFFNACIIHEQLKKNEKNIYCLDCCTSICPHCLSLHRSHRLLQIRRYVYHDVIRLSDAEKLLDCKYVKSYTTNSAKVVFLNKRPQTRQWRGASGNICITCERSLQDLYHFCSLCCKINHVIRTQGRLSKYLRECNFLSLSEPGLGEDTMPPESFLDPAAMKRIRSEPSRYDEADCRMLACSTAATTDISRKRRSNLSMFRSVNHSICKPVSGFIGGLAKRRKGTPHRSPLY